MSDFFLTTDVPNVDLALAVASRVYARYNQLSKNSESAVHTLDYLEAVARILRQIATAGLSERLSSQIGAVCAVLEEAEEAAIAATPLATAGGPSWLNNVFHGTKRFAFSGSLGGALDEVNKRLDSTIQLLQASLAVDTKVDDHDLLVGIEKHLTVGGILGGATALTPVRTSPNIQLEEVAIPPAARAALVASAQVIGAPLGTASVEVPTSQMTAAKVVELLWAGGGVESIALAGVAALREKTGDSESDQKAAVDAFAPAAIVAAMHKHMDNEDVVKKGCTALYFIAFNFEAGQKASVDALAPAAIVTAMRKHMGNKDVAKNGCIALGAIAVNFDDGQKAVVDALAPAAIVEAMHKHMDNEDFAFRGCMALGAITNGFEAGQKAAVDALAPAAIVAAMHKHMDNEYVVKKGCMALIAIANGFEAGRKAAVDAFASAAIVEAMCKHMGNEDVANYGRLALDAIALNSETGQKLAIDALAPAAG